MREREKKPMESGFKGREDSEMKTKRCITTRESRYEKIRRVTRKWSR